MFPFHNGFVNAGPSGHIVRFDRQEFLKGMSRAVGLKRPDLHLSQALASELSLPSQGLLGHQGIGPNRTGMDLLIHQMMQLKQVHIAHGHLMMKGITRSPVVEGGLPAHREPCLVQMFLDLLLRGPIKNRDRDVNSFAQFPGQFNHLFLRRLLQIFVHLF